MSFEINSIHFRNFQPHLENCFVDFLDKVFQEENEISLAALVRKLEFFIPGKKQNKFLFLININL